MFCRYQDQAGREFAREAVVQSPLMCRPDLSLREQAPSHMGLRDCRICDSPESTQV